MFGCKLRCASFAPHGFNVIRKRKIMDNLLIFALGEFLIILAMMYVIFTMRKSENKAPETRLLHFGAVVLTGLGLVFMLAMAMYYFEPQNSTKGKEIFDQSSTMLAPLITLVLGYYFGKDK